MQYPSSDSSDGIRLRDKAVFLDKDGTLVQDVPYNVDPALICLLPGATEALAALHRSGYKLVVVSNQSGVARGYFAEAALVDVERQLRSLLAAADIPLAGFYYCPHHPAGSVPAYAIACECRKPESGMLIRAAAEHGIDLTASWMVGDSLNDVEAGRRAGCRTVLIHSSGDSAATIVSERTPDFRATDLAEAASIILTVA